MRELKRQVKHVGDLTYLNVLREHWPLCVGCEHCEGLNGTPFVRSDYVRGRVCIYCDSALDELLEESERDMADDEKKEITLNAVPYKEGEPAPRDHIFMQVKTPDGKVTPCWVRTADLPKIPTPKVKRSTLTPEQRRRSHTIFRKVKKFVTHHAKNEKQWDDGFELDMNPEFELMKWERLATVLHEERSVRPKEEHGLLFKALLMAINGEANVGTIISMDPRLKGLSNLTRPMLRMQEIAREQGVRA